MRSLFCLPLIFACATPAPTTLKPPAHYDAGFLENPVSLAPIRWAPSDLPLMLAIQPAAGRWAGHVEACASRWNSVIGLTAFIALGVVGGDYSKPISGTIFVLNRPPLVRLSTLHGSEITGRLVYATILVPSAGRLLDPLNEDLAREAACHELGHVLGLDHDTDPRSVMFPKIRREDLPKVITPSDAARLRQWYIQDLPGPKEIETRTGPRVLTRVDTCLP